MILCSPSPGSFASEKMTCVKRTGGSEIMSVEGRGVGADVP